MLFAQNVGHGKQVVFRVRGAFRGSPIDYSVSGLGGFLNAPNSSALRSSTSADAVFATALRQNARQ